MEIWPCSQLGSQDLFPDCPGLSQVGTDALIQNTRLVPIYSAWVFTLSMILKVEAGAATSWILDWDKRKDSKATVVTNAAGRIGTNAPAATIACGWCRSC